MAPTCPKCAYELKDDYGMVTCPGCGSIVFVDLEGNANVASDASPQHESSSLSSVPEPFAAPEMAPSASTDGGPGDPSASEPDLGPDSGPESGMDMNAFLGYTPEQAALPSDAGSPLSQSDPNDPLGISAYSNSELSTAKNGPLVVTLIISGIDAKDLRDEIRQALQDSRFGWDTAALMSGIKGGTLRIEQVSPVKATVIINRIKNLSVRIRWEQNAITEIEPFSPKP